MAHEVSLTYSRFEHMPPSALALTTLLHVLVAVALFWISPLRPVEHFEDAIDITMDAPPVQPPPQATPEPTPAPTPTPPPSAVQPPPQAAPPQRLGLAPPGTNNDPRARPGTETPAQRTQEMPTTEPERQQAAAQPEPQPPPPPKPLEMALPPLEAPPPPVTERDIPKPAPAPRPPTPPPPQQAHRPTPPPPPQQQPRPSPLAQVPQQRPPADQQAAAQPSPAFRNPADNYGQKKAQEDYLWQVMRRIAQFPYVPKNTSTIREEGTVLTRVTISRDGRLMDVVMEKSSGLPSLDAGVMDTIRRASPYPPLPADIPGDRHTFQLPVSFRFNQAR